MNQKLAKFCKILDFVVFLGVTFVVCEYKDEACMAYQIECVVQEVLGVGMENDEIRIYVVKFI